MRNIKLQILETLHKAQFYTLSLDDLRGDFGSSPKINNTLGKLKRSGLIKPAEIPFVQVGNESISVDAYQLTDKGKPYVKARPSGFIEVVMNPWNL